MDSHLSCARQTAIAWNFGELGVDLTETISVGVLIVDYVMDAFSESQLYQIFVGIFTNTIRIKKKNQSSACTAMFYDHDTIHGNCFFLPKIVDLSS